jgi:subtilase family serine protease
LKFSLTRTRVAVLVVGAAAIVAGTAGSLGSAHAASGRQAIPNTRPAWLSHATNQGHASPGAAVDARIYLTPNGGMAKLQQFALAVSTPGDAQFRHFLKPSQYFQRFGTTDGTVSAVKSWLTGAGLHIPGVEQHNR